MDESNSEGRSDIYNAMKAVKLDDVDALNDAEVEDPSHETGDVNSTKDVDESDLLEIRRAKESLYTDEQIEDLKIKSLELKDKGNIEFGKQCWEEAIRIYSEALELCPLVCSSERSKLLSNRAATYLNTNSWDEAIKDSTEAINIGAINNKPLKRRAYAYSKSEQNYEKAIKDYEALILLEPNDSSHRDSIFSLQKEIAERHKKMQEEMMSKLKSVGNACLRPFGLSLDSFEVKEQQGGYSVTMKK